MNIFYTRDDNSTRHVVIPNRMALAKETLCGKVAYKAEPLALPVNCDECRTQNGRQVKARQATRPTPENYGTIWVCVCCMLSHANGECCSLDTHSDGCEPLSSIEEPFHVAMGMDYEEHEEDCLFRTQGSDAPDDYECECERNTYSTSQCAGCSSYLHGERHAMTLFKDGA